MWKANVMIWTRERGFETTEKTVHGLIYRNPIGPWCVATEFDKNDRSGVSVMVDKDTVRRTDG